VEEATRDALFDDDAIPRPHERSLYVTTPRLNGDDVAAVQQRLVDLGYVEVGEVDGYYGPKTEFAVLRFQKINGLPDSGMVDEQAWKVIFGGDAVPGW
jgi:peptidoglycan hydrolase-like protein with peptidoglycan-binding domain